MKLGDMLYEVARIILILTNIIGWSALAIMWGWLFFQYPEFLQ